MLRIAAIAVALLMPAFLVAGEPKKTEPKEETKKESKKPEFPFPMPDFDKLIPPGLDPAKRAEMRKMLEKYRAEMTKKMEEMRKAFPGGQFPAGFPIGGIGQPFPPGGFPFAPFMMANRLGARLEPPSPTLVDQLDLPAKQGMVVQDVGKDSAAAKAGLKANDILLELDGKAVPNRPDLFFKMLQDFKVDEKVDAVVIRKGKKETIKGLNLPEAKNGPGAFPGFPGAFPMPPGFPPGGFPPGGFPMPPIGFPNIPGIQGGANIAMTLTRDQNGNFMALTREGTKTIKVIGKVEEGEATIKTIEIRDGEKTSNYKSLDEVPEVFRNQVQALIRASQTGNAKKKETK